MNSDYMIFKKENQKEYNELKKENATFKLLYKKVKEENAILKQDLASVQQRLASEQQRLASVDQELAEMRAKLNSLDVREAMRVLEHHIALDIVGSKTHIKKEHLFSITNLSNLAYSTQLYTKYSHDLYDMLILLKESGNIVAHTGINDSLALENAILTKTDTTKAKKLKLQLVKLLVNFAQSKSMSISDSPLFR